MKEKKPDTAERALSPTMSDVVQQLRKLSGDLKGAPEGQRLAILKRIRTLIAEADRLTGV